MTVFIKNTINKILCFFNCHDWVVVNYEAVCYLIQETETKLLHSKPSIFVTTAPANYLAGPHNVTDKVCIRCEKLDLNISKTKTELHSKYMKQYKREQKAKQIMRKQKCK